MEEMLKFLKALVLLQLNDKEQEGTQQKPELILHKAGFTAAEIADMLGKSRAAAAKAVSRAKKG